MAVKIKRRNGKWYVVVHHDGRRKARCIGHSRQAAEEVRRRIEAKLAAGEFSLDDPSSRPNPTFEIYADQWLTEYADVELKYSTAARHRQILRSYIYPRFAKVEMAAIKREHVKRFLTEYATARKLSRNSIRLILCSLRTILNHAIEDELIETNPAARLGRSTKTEKPKRQAQAMTREEAERLLEAVLAVCPGFYPLFLTALRTGLRRGELVALRWGDIEFGNGEEDPNRYILVQHNYVLGRFTTPKSKKSRRVDLSQQLRGVLLALRQQREVEALRAGKASIMDDLVFPSQAGTVMNGENITNRYFHPALEKAKLRRFRLHDLRHTYGSLLIQDGASLPYVRDQMGHYSIQVTVDTYGHLIPGANVSWIDRLDSRPTSAPSASQTHPAAETPPPVHADGAVQTRVMRPN